MSDETVTVTALKDHTAFGGSYVAGDTYTVDASDVASLVAQGLAKAPETPAPAAKPSQPVEPITAAEFRPRKEQP